jgi:hypothetical protein
VLTVISGIPSWQDPAGGGDPDGIQDGDFQTTNQSTEFEFDGNWIGNSKNGYFFSDDQFAMTEDHNYYVPVWVGKRCKVTNLGFNNIAGATGTMTVEMALFSNRTDGTNYPNTNLEVDSFSASASSTFKHTDNGFLDENIEAGLYWICINIVNTSGTPQITGLTPYNATIASNVESDLDIMLPCMALHPQGTQTSIPATSADSDMDLIAESAPALWMQVVPNTS